MEFWHKNINHFRQRWTLDDQIQFFYYVWHYTKNGVPLIETLQLLQSTFPKKYLHDFKKMRTHLKQGKNLYDLFRKLKFDADVISIFELGKESEKSQFLFQKCYQILLQKKNFRHFIKKLFSYPLLLLFLVMGSGMFMAKTILPQYKDMVPRDGTVMGELYYIMNHFFSFAPTILFFFLLSVLCFVLLMKYFPLTLRIFLLRLQIHIPIYGKIIKKFQSYFLLQRLIAILKSQFTLAEGIHLFQKSENQWICYQARVMEAGFFKGKNLYEIICEMGFYDEQFAYVLLHAQTHGHLLKELEGFSELLKEEMLRIIERSLRGFQIFTFILVALYIFVLYGAVLFPMYSMFETF